MLETVTMVTSPTSEKITKGEVKVSGSCQFNTTLPRKEGNYSFLVSVSPGKRNFMVEDKQFTVGNYTSLRLLSLLEVSFLERYTKIHICAQIFMDIQTETQKHTYP